MTFFVVELLLPKAQCSDHHLSETQMDCKLGGYGNNFVQLLDDFVIADYETVLCAARVPLSKMFALSIVQPRVKESSNCKNYIK